jgi:hypothetical protein
MWSHDNKPQYSMQSQGMTLAQVEGYATRLSIDRITIVFGTNHTRIAYPKHSGNGHEIRRTVAALTAWHRAIPIMMGVAHI